MTTLNRIESMITESQLDELIEAVQAANLVCPDQVCDMVEAAADNGGYEAGLAELAKAKENDAAESKSLGIDE